MSFSSAEEAKAAVDAFEFGEGTAAELESGNNGNEEGDDPDA